MFLLNVTFFPYPQGEQSSLEQQLVVPHLPPKLVITTPWKALCVDLIGPYTLKGKDGSSIDFMCLTMINPGTSWFEIVEPPTVAQEMTVLAYGFKVLLAVCPAKCSDIFLFSCRFLLRRTRERLI